VLELEETDRQLLSRCSEQAFHTFMLAWGSHMQANASNAFGALEDFCSNKGKAHVGLLRAWTGWLLSDGPLGVPLVDEADKRFKPLSGHVDAGVGMMIPNGKVFVFFLPPPFQSACRGLCKMVIPHDGEWILHHTSSVHLKWSQHRQSGIRAVPTTPTAGA